VGALDVLPVDKAREYLNIRTSELDEGELAEFIGAAVERVERHIAGEAGIGSTLVTAATTSALQLLAVKAVLGEYWRTQRVRVGRGIGAGSTAAAVEADTGPAGAAAIRIRLEDLLGPPFDGNGSDPPAPRGSFPAPVPWPDPARLRWGWPW
jgi:hypothetical protein